MREARSEFGLALSSEGRNRGAAGVGGLLDEDPSNTSFSALRIISPSIRLGQNHLHMRTKNSPYIR